MAQVTERVIEIILQPLPSTQGLSEIEFLENREFTFLVKDGKILVGRFVNFHNETLKEVGLSASAG